MYKPILKRRKPGFPVFPRLPIHPWVLGVPRLYSSASVSVVATHANCV